MMTENRCRPRRELSFGQMLLLAALAGGGAALLIGMF